MVIDPVNVRAKPHGGISHRILRGAIGFAVCVCDLEVGHQRDTEHPVGFSQDHGLRLSLTLPCNSEGGLVE